MSEETLELLCFQLGDSAFAVDIMGIAEILRGQRVTQVPQAPVHVAGVINLRSVLIPVIDLQQVLLGRPRLSPVTDPKLVVVRTGGRPASFLVDNVLEVASISIAELTPVPGVHPGGKSVVVAAFRRDLPGISSPVVLLVRLRSILEGEALPFVEGIP